MPRKAQTKSTSDVKAELAERQGRDAPAREYAQPLDRLLASKDMQAQLARAVPRTVDLDRLLRVLLTVVRQNPQLMRCEVPTVLGALMQCAQLGLEPGPLEEAYFVPFRNKALARQRGGGDVYECQFIVGYKGIVKLALQSPTVEDVVGRVVYEGDDFEVRYGTRPDIDHVPRFRTHDPAKITHAYAVAHFVGSGVAMEAMSRARIEERRARSASARSGRGSPWDTDYAAMAAKTPVRALRPWLPLTTQLADALAADERTSRWTAEMDGPIVDMLPPTPEELARGDEPGELPDEEMLKQLVAKGRKHKPAEVEIGKLGVPHETIARIASDGRVEAVEALTEDEREAAGKLVHALVDGAVVIGANDRAEAADTGEPVALGDLGELVDQTEEGTTDAKA